MKCPDCGKAIKEKVIIGRMSAKNIWVDICKDCDDKFKKTKGYKKVKSLLGKIDKLKK